ncbi:hypothetical protein Ddye_023327 [Dipteronia dyeriana]|uniref:cytokinin riboside 5'-monophosphate phosphoribohydrolase n=1 Tax=Dipteronia dyeriana TaxID=168575 RepID=A0AAD9WS11_9ROSI|nr:hypothetical protein Ddye_023327 [Dipteronia dyeriana]
MPESLTAMLHHANAFIALPGGFGTLEKILTMESSAQLHIHEKPIATNAEMHQLFLASEEPPRPEGGTSSS